MTPVHCQLKHDPEEGIYGDCVRACIASLLDLLPDAVPHFFHDNCSGETAQRRIETFLADCGLVPFWAGFSGEMPLFDVMQYMHVANPNVYYMLYGSTRYGSHVVICRGMETMHDPAWYSVPIVRPSGDDWTIMVIARL